MRAVLLCAGFGTRLHPLTIDRAKPLLPVAGKPIVQHLVEALRPHVESFVIVGNARFHRQLAAWAPKGSLVLNDGAETDEQRLGAVRDLALAVDRLGLDEPVLVAGGDNLFRFRFADLFADYRAAPRNLVLLHRENDTGKLRRTGVAVIDAAGRVVRLAEKPAEPPSDLACPPLYILRPDALRLLPAFLEEDPRGDAPGELIAWLCRRIPVFAHVMDGRRLDIGDPETYARAERWLREDE